MKAARRGQRGMSLLEASIMLAATAIAASILLPRVSETNLHVTRAAERGLDVGAQLRGEAAFRALISDASPANAEIGGFAAISGDALTIRLRTAGAGGAPCGDAPTGVTLKIANETRGGQLTCIKDGEAAAYTMMTWRAGAGRFSYNPDGRAWVAGFDPLRRRDAVPVLRLVRFEIVDGATTHVSWIAAIGADGAPLAPPERSGERSPLNP